MESRCISFREVRHTTKLFSLFLEEFDLVAPYYAHPPTEEGLAASAREVQLDPSARHDVVEVLREQNLRFAPDGSLDVETTRNLDRLAAGAMAIVTGQQVGLFSGPAFNLYKAVSVLHCAREATRRGIDAVPVFWLATEDHDLAEVNQSYWNTRSGLVRHALPEKEDDAGRRVGEVALGEAITPIVAKAVESLEGTFSEEIVRALRESYGPRETYGSAYGKLMARLLAGRGIIFLDPLDVRLHRLAVPAYLRALDEADELSRALLMRSKELEDRGLHAQVKVTREATLLFCNVNRRREPVRSRNNRFLVAESSFTPAELRAEIERSPESFTPNVLLRPVIQDALLPTAAYIGGPAEIAYMAQAQVVYRKILGRMPAILPRGSFTIIESHVARVLRKYGLEFQDVLHGRQHLRSKMERKSLPRGLSRRFEADEEALRRLLKAYTKPLERLDRSLLGALQVVERKMLHQLQKLRAKAGRAENFRTGTLDGHERLLLDSLYPKHGLQERTLSALPLLAVHGPDLLDDLGRLFPALGSADSSLCAHQHHVLFL
jgi:bacillithiol biosynthesis cysteine-adding enzyme BshC